MNNKTKLIIVDDHPLVAQGIASLLKRNPQINVIGIFESATVALSKIEILQPDIVLTDLDMPRMNGLEFAQSLKKIGFQCKIILLTMHLNQSVVKKVMSQKIEGYLPKNADAFEINACLSTVISGGTYYSPKAMETLLSDSQKMTVTGLKKSQNLSNREREILVLIAEGLSTKDISKKLFIAIRTVETHRKSILEKLEVSNVAGMVRIAVQEGLLED